MNLVKISSEVVGVKRISERNPVFKLGVRWSLKLRCGHGVHIKACSVLPSFVWCKSCTEEANENEKD